MAILLPDDACEYDSTTFRSGALVHDRYEVISLLGHGASGAVYQARDTRLHRTVALKHTLPADEAAQRAFAREAEVLARLQHECLPTVGDYFCDAQGQFLVMPFVPGDDLGAVLRRRRKSFPYHEVLHWANLVLDVLAHLHAQDPPIVHGDIKPGNLKPTDSGGLVLVDFELSKDAMGAARAAAGRSLAGHTARYSAPEWIEGKPTDARTDLYALGATLYHLLTGAPPPSALDRERAERIRQADPLPSLDLVNPSVPRAISLAVARAMALNPDDRFASADEMRKALYGAEEDASVLKALASEPRRVDAAAPSWVVENQAFDFHVQVRFFDSPRLGREDWPVEHGAGMSPQASDVARLLFKPSPWGAAIGPAVVVVRLATADFTIEGEAEQLLDVPSHDYSRRIGFRLHTLKTRLCRINAEIYTEEGVGIGVIPVDVRVGGELARPPLRVGHLPLRVAARSDALHAPVASPPTAAPPVQPKPVAFARAEAMAAPAPSVPAPTFGTISREDREDEPAWRWRDVLMAVIALVVAIFILSYVAASVRSRSSKTQDPAAKPAPAQTPAATPPR